MEEATRRSDTPIAPHLKRAQKSEDGHLRLLLYLSSLEVSSIPLQIVKNLLHV